MTQGLSRGSCPSFQEVFLSVSLTSLVLYSISSHLAFWALTGDLLTLHFSKMMSLLE